MSGHPGLSQAERAWRRLRRRSQRRHRVGKHDQGRVRRVQIAVPGRREACPPCGAQDALSEVRYEPAGDQGGRKRSACADACAHPPAAGGGGGPSALGAERPGGARGRRSAHGGLRRTSRSPRSCLPDARAGARPTPPRRAAPAVPAPPAPPPEPPGPEVFGGIGLPDVPESPRPVQSAKRQDRAAAARLRRDRSHGRAPEPDGRRGAGARPGRSAGRLRQ